MKMKFIIKMFITSTKIILKLTYIYLEKVGFRKTTSYKNR